MQFLDIVCPTLAENIALDEALLLSAESLAGRASDGGNAHPSLARPANETLRLWRWPYHAVVLGAGGRIADDVREDACRADGVPILRRSSGGGTVLLGLGCLLYTVILRFEHHPLLSDLHGSYRSINGRIIAGLEAHVSPLAVQGSSDLTWADRKFSGNAQQRKRTYLLQHGSLLHAFDLPAIGRYLKSPPRQPEYRRQRGHADFLTNLPIPGATLERMLRDVWQAYEPMTEWPAEMVATLVKEKYGNDEWIRRR